MSSFGVASAAPRRVVDAYLSALRLPLAAAERLAGRRGDENWPPALAYDHFDAGVRSVIGSLLRDATLVEQGRLRQAKVTQLRKAAELETLAEQERESAAASTAAKQRKVAEQRVATTRQAQQRKVEAAQRTEKQERQAQQQAAKEKAAARRAEAARDEAIERQERAAKIDALDAEAEALRVADQALDTADTVDVIDASIEGVKEARRTG